MNEEIKRKADAIAEQFDKYVLFNPLNGNASRKATVYCAILSTKNTIEVLKEAFESLDNEYDKSTLCGFLDQQTEILKELESRI